MKDSLTPRMREVLVGLLLGDGHLETQNQGRTYRLKVEHSIAQRDYTEWLFQLFKSLCQQSVLYEKEKYGKKYVGFRTRSLGTFRFYAQQFYKNGKKVMPASIGKLLTETGLAIWYLDDGSRKSNRHTTFIIHSLGFTKNELMNIAQVLKSKFKVSVKLHRQKQRYFRLYIPSSSSKQFRNIIEPLVLRFSSMAHKIGNTQPKK